MLPRAFRTRRRGKRQRPRPREVGTASASCRDLTLEFHRGSDSLQAAPRVDGHAAASPVEVTVLRRSVTAHASDSSDANVPRGPDIGVANGAVGSACAQAQCSRRWSRARAGGNAGGNAPSRARCCRSGETMLRCARACGQGRPAHIRRALRLGLTCDEIGELPQKSCSANLGSRPPGDARARTTRPAWADASPA
jgi:hypothetical protein